MARILIYYPRNVKNTPIDFPLLELQRRGHQLLHLTMDPPGNLHQHYTHIGVPAAATEGKPWPGPLRYIWHAYKLGKAARRFCPDIVFSHLQEANIVAVFAQQMGWLPMPLVVFRHSGTAIHLAPPELARTVPLAEHIFDRFLNRFAKRIIVPGEGVRQLMLREGTDARKVSIIPYMYDFNAMKGSFSQADVAAIRAAHPAQLLLVSTMRFVPFKRHIVLLDLMQRLVAQHLPVRLVLLDVGPEWEPMKQRARELGIDAAVDFVGRKPNVLPYLAAADLVLHPSLTDASNSVVKETGLVGTPAIVVTGVGDFDDYFVDGENGFLVPTDQFAEAAEHAVKGILNGSIDYRQMGKRLGQAVLAKFSIRSDVVDLYEALLPKPLLAGS